MQTKQVHVRISQEEAKDLAAVAEPFGISSTLMARFLLAAAIHTAKSEEKSFKIPPEFKLACNGSSKK